MNAKKGEIVVFTLAEGDLQFRSMACKPGLQVIDIFAKFAGPCDAMNSIFLPYKVELGEKIGFIRALSDSISCLEYFRDHSCPFFLIIYNGTLVQTVRGANAPLIEKIIKHQFRMEENGEEHKQIDSDEITRPIIDFLFQQPPELDRARSGSIASRPASSRLSTVQKQQSVLEAKPANLALETVDESAPLERTLAILKPDAMTPSIMDEVITLLKHNRFEIAQMKKIWLSTEQAEELFRESSAKDYFGRMIEYMTCAPVLAIELSKPNAIEAWRAIVGPRDPKDAKSDAPKSLRGLYGRDRLMNSFHASDGPVSAARELELIFYSPTPMLVIETFQSGEAIFPVGSGLPQKTLAVIKPEILDRESIISKIVARGFDIVKREEMMLSVERAQLLSIEYLETPNFDESVRSLMSGPVLCLLLKGENVIQGWVEMLGPSDPEVARRLCPPSLRALYGTNEVVNGLHGSQTVELAVTQIQAFFPHFLASAASINSIFKTPMGSLQASRAGSRANLANASLRASVEMLEGQRATLRAAADASIHAQQINVEEGGVEPAAELLPEQTDIPTNNEEGHQLDVDVTEQKDTSVARHDVENPEQTATEEKTRPDTAASARTAAASGETEAVETAESRAEEATSELESYDASRPLSADAFGPAKTRPDTAKTLSQAELERSGRVKSSSSSILKDHSRQSSKLSADGAKYSPPTARSARNASTIASRQDSLQVDKTASRSGSQLNQRSRANSNRNAGSPGKSRNRAASNQQL